MKRYAKIAAGVLSLAMLGTMAACGAKTESQQSALESLDVSEFYERYIAWQTAYVEKNELVEK